MLSGVFLYSCGQGSLSKLIHLPALFFHSFQMKSLEWMASGVVPKDVLRECDSRSNSLGKQQKINEGPFLAGFFLDTL